jgi:two-component system chemotaxis sensor kinase CheA
VDSLINMVGELVITQSMLNVLSEDELLQGMEKLQQGLGQLQRQTRALQEGVMQIRMLPISFCFNRFPRMVRDLSRQLDKDIELILAGEHTEVDKTVIEKISDPLVHLVRNSVDHGIEVREERLQRGKPEQGSVWLRAYHEVGNIIIEVEDDGKGLDTEALLAKAKKKGLVAENAQLSKAQVFDLIFAPGFSTKDEATDLSGRGVGMDVVKRNVQTLGGSIAIDSEFGRGTRITIRLPLTLAIMDGQLARVGDEIFVVPLVAIIESLQPEAGMINKMAGTQETIRLRGQYLPVLRLAETFGVPLPEDDRDKPLTDGIVVIVEHEHKRFGIFLDDLLSQQQIVIKSLDENYHTVEGISSATILGDGRVALILDVASLCQLQQKAEGYANVG